jgi:hypothetical protein
VENIGYSARGGTGNDKQGDAIAKESCCHIVLGTSDYLDRQRSRLINGRDNDIWVVEE